MSTDSTTLQVTKTLLKTSITTVTTSTIEMTTTTTVTTAATTSTSVTTTTTTTTTRTTTTVTTTTTTGITINTFSPITLTQNTITTVLNTPIFNKTLEFRNMTTKLHYTNPKEKIALTTTTSRKTTANDLYVKDSSSSTTISNISNKNVQKRVKIQETQKKLDEESDEYDYYSYYKDKLGDFKDNEIEYYEEKEPNNVEGKVISGLTASSGVLQLVRPTARKEADEEDRSISDSRKLNNVNKSILKQIDNVVYEQPSENQEVRSRFINKESVDKGSSITRAEKEDVDREVSFQLTDNSTPSQPFKTIHKQGNLQRRKKVKKRVRPLPPTDFKIKFETEEDIHKPMHYENSGDSNQGISIIRG